MDTGRCRYLAGGLAFRYGTVASCGVVHHGRGTPVLLDYNGGPLPIDELLEQRRAISDGSHPSCTGCPNLGEVHEADYPVTWLGVTHFNFCNVSCTYCWLSTASYSPRNTGQAEKPYRILPIVKTLIEKKMLAPDAIVDWGGGGEPTLMPDFDDSFDILDAHGCVQWLHTNATRMPPRARRGQLSRERVRVLCSLDCGRRETYQKIKLKDLFERVCENLATYCANGAYVAIKYLMAEENCTFEEIEHCLSLMKQWGAAEFVPDIDYDKPDPSEAIVRGLAYAKMRCQQLEIPFQLGSTGVNSGLEYLVHRRVENEYYRLALNSIVA